MVTINMMELFFEILKARRGEISGEIKAWTERSWVSADQGGVIWWKCPAELEVKSGVQQRD
jgi:hypothetical protein